MHFRVILGHLQAPACSPPPPFRALGSGRLRAPSDASRRLQVGGSGRKKKIHKGSKALSHSPLQPLNRGTVGGMGGFGHGGSLQGQGRCSIISSLPGAGDTFSAGSEKVSKSCHPGDEMMIQKSRAEHMGQVRLFSGTTQKKSPGASGRCRCLAMTACLRIARYHV